MEIKSFGQYTQELTKQGYSVAILEPASHVHKVRVQVKHVKDVTVAKQSLLINLASAFHKVSTEYGGRFPVITLTGMAGFLFCAFKGYSYGVPVEKFTQIIEGQK